MKLSHYWYWRQLDSSTLNIAKAEKRIIVSNMGYQAILAGMIFFLSSLVFTDLVIIVSGLCLFLTLVNLIMVAMYRNTSMLKKIHMGVAGVFTLFTVLNLIHWWV